MDIDTFTELADAMAEEIPPALLEGLNGGIAIEARAERRSDDPPGVYLLGEYITDDLLGCFIVLYYGSFRRLFRGEPDEVWANELRTTLRHEVRHHVEARAGLHDLDDDDDEQLRRLWQEWAGEDDGEPQTRVED